MAVTGLMHAEVLEKRKLGLVNDYEPAPTKRVPVIVLRNVFIVFNLLLAPLLVVLLVMGQYKDIFSVGVIAFINTMINIIQEIQAKRALDRIRVENPATAWVIRDNKHLAIPIRQIVQEDCLVLKAGEIALADGPVLEATHLEMDESMLTGESDYIPKGSGAQVLSGSFAVVGEGVYRAEKIGADCYMQKVVEQGRRLQQHKTPVERKVDLLVNAFIGCCFVVAAGLLLKFQPFSGGAADVAPIRYIVASVTTMIPQGLVLIVTITFALGVITFARRGIIFRKINAVESLSNVDLICMDKTGTLTHNRIVLDRVVPVDGEKSPHRALAAFAGAAKERNKTVEAIASGLDRVEALHLDEVPFKSRNKFSALRLELDGEKLDLLLGAYELISNRMLTHDQERIAGIISAAERDGFRTLAFARRSMDHAALNEDIAGFELVAVIIFQEAIKEEAPEILTGFFQEGVEQVVISGDSLQTVQSVAMRIGLPDAQCGVTGGELEALGEAAFREKVLASRIFARVKPEQKRDIIRVFKASGRYTAMVGDGVNDVLALKEADLAIAMGSGGSMARDVSDIVLVNNRFSVLPDLLAEGDRIISRIKDCARIFTLKNFYALIMVAAALLTGITFPFLPQQITMLNFITITVPLLYLIKFSRYKEKLGGSFLKDILKCSLTMGSVIAGTGIALNAWYTVNGVVPEHFVGFFGDAAPASVRLAQSAALVPVIILALLAYLYIINRSRGFHGLLKDKKVLFVVLGLLLGFIGISHLRPAQKFFEVIPYGWMDWGRALLFLLPALLIQRAVAGCINRPQAE